MNKIFQLLLVAYVAFYLTDSRNDELRYPPVRESVNGTSADNSTAEIGGLKIKSEIRKENTTLPQFARETVANLTSNNAITRIYYPKDGAATTFNFVLPIHLRAN